jgi:ABC-type Mn2+/Zn2+ transport system ATPase subunit
VTVTVQSTEPPAGPGTAPHASAEPLAVTRELAAGYGGPPVIESVSFAVAPGDRIGLLGPNGGGKSTLFRALLGDLAPVRGALDVAVSVATVPQTERSRLDYPVSALEVALMGTLSRLPWWRRPGRRERRQALAALDTVGLADLASRTFGELSGGQRQRVLMARALVQDARLLLLDEPFSGLDAPASDRLMDLLDALAAEGRGVVVATHDVEQVQRWDLVLCLNHDQVAFGPPATTLTGEVLEATYGGSIVRIPGDGDGPARVILPPHHHDHG